MPSNLLLLLPLLAGFLFTHLFHRRRFRAQTKTGHRLIFEAAAAGLGFLVVARVITATLMWFHWPSRLIEAWPRITNSVEFVGTTTLSLVLAIGTGVGLNLAFGFRNRALVAPESIDRPHLVQWCYRWWEASRKYSLDVALRRSGNALQKILHNAVQFGAVDGRTVGLTLTSGKVYAGWVMESPSLSPEDEYVSLLPLMSGHRDKETLKIEYDFPYPLAKFEALAEESDVVVAIPVSSIQSAHLLDVEYWGRELARLRQRTASDSGGDSAA